MFNDCSFGAFSLGVNRWLLVAAAIVWFHYLYARS